MREKRESAGKNVGFLMSPLPGNSSKDRKLDLKVVVASLTYVLIFLVKKRASVVVDVKFRGKIHKQQAKSRFVCSFVHLTLNAKAERG